MNNSNSKRLALMVFGFVVVATTTAANAQQRYFAPQSQSTYRARLGIHTTYEQVGPHNGVVATFGERIGSVQQGSAAERSGLEPGDTIVGYYMGNSYRKITSQATLKFGVISSRGLLRVKVINVRNGQYVNVTIRFNFGNSQGGNGNGGGGPVVHDHRQPQTSVNPTTPPPASPNQTPAARSGYVWIAGHYVWRNGSYQWTRGHWEGKKANKAAWIPGYWSRQGDHWVWTAGRWTKVGPTIKGRRR